MIIWHGPAPLVARAVSSFGLLATAKSTHSYPVPAIVVCRLCSPENVTGCEKTEFGVLVKKLKWHGNTGLNIFSRLRAARLKMTRRYRRGETFSCSLTKMNLDSIACHKA